MKLGIQTSKKHKVKGRQYLTLMMISDVTKNARTLRIPKWFRFPLMILIVATILFGFHVYQYILDLEAQVVVQRVDIQEGSMTLEEKLAYIESLELTNDERHKQLLALQDLAIQLGQRLESLEKYKEEIQEYKEEIDTQLNNEEDGEAVLTMDQDFADIRQTPFSTSMLVGQASLAEELAPESKQAVLNQNGSLNFEEEVGQVSHYLATLIDETNIEEDHYLATSESMEEILPYVEVYPSILPLEDTAISSPFGYRRDPLHTWRSEFHTGVDLRAYYEDIVATGGGEVVIARYQSGWGYTVLIDHGYGLTSRHAHLSRIYVSEGDTVTRGDTIGRTGNSGPSTGPHLHYEIRLKGEPVNPMEYVYESKES